MSIYMFLVIFTIRCRNTQVSSYFTNSISRISNINKDKSFFLPLINNMFIGMVNIMTSQLTADSFHLFLKKFF